MGDGKATARTTIQHTRNHTQQQPLQWGVHAGGAWELVEGADGGQTHADAPADGAAAVWAHPLDVHYVCRGLAGWPRLAVQVWAQDAHGRNELSELEPALREPGQRQRL